MRVPIPTKRIQVNVRLTNEQARKLRRLAIREKVSLSDYIRRLLERVKE